MIAVGLGPAASGGEEDHTAPIFLMLKSFHSLWLFLIRQMAPAPAPGLVRRLSPQEAELVHSASRAKFRLPSDIENVVLFAKKKSPPQH